jgi:uncharacterized membrane protein
MPTFNHVVESVGLVVDGAGVVAIVLGLLIALGRYFTTGLHQLDGFRRFRQDLGRGILLGLEFLVAADIIRTVGVTPTLEGVLVLGIIVLIRSFLSMALQVEVEGRWPWQREVPALPAPANRT